MLLFLRISEELFSRAAIQHLCNLQLKMLTLTILFSISLVSVRLNVLKVKLLTYQLLKDSITTTTENYKTQSSHSKPKETHSYQEEHTVISNTNLVTATTQKHAVFHVRKQHSQYSRYHKHKDYVIHVYISVQVVQMEQDVIHALL